MTFQFTVTADVGDCVVGLGCKGLAESGAQKIHDADFAGVISGLPVVVPARTLFSQMP
jgi:hypothetical protein